jgi:RNA polymerase sigma-70 factor (ECF subfamily)
MTDSLSINYATTRDEPGTASKDTTPSGAINAAICLKMTRDEFDVFYRQTAPALGSYIRRMTGATDDDLLQDSYVRLLGASPATSDAGQLRAYLYRIATRLVLDRWRKEHRQRAYVSEAARGLSGQNPAGASGFERCFGLLAPRERMMLWLAHVEGLSHNEVAAAMGCNAASVRVMLFRARRKLEGILRKNGWQSS